MTDSAQALLQMSRYVARNVYLRRLLVLRKKTLRQALSRHVVLRSEGQRSQRALRESLIGSMISAGRLCDPRLAPPSPLCNLGEARPGGDIRSPAIRRRLSRRDFPFPDRWRRGRSASRWWAPSTAGTRWPIPWRRPRPGTGRRWCTCRRGAMCITSGWMACPDWILRMTAASQTPGGRNTPFAISAAACSPSGR